MRAVTDHAYSGRGPKILKPCKIAMTRFADFLKMSKPRRVQRATRRSWFVYTDACYEPTNSDWACGIGGLLVAPDGTPVQAFSFKLNDSHTALLGSKLRRRSFLKRSFWRLLLLSNFGRRQYRVARLFSSLTTTVFETSLYLAVRDQAVANNLLEILLQTESHASIFTWFARVPSPSNPSDGLSRGDCGDLNRWRVQTVSVDEWVECIMQKISCACPS